MNFFLIFALIFFTIIVAIFLQKLVNSPILIGLLFFSVFILTAYSAFLKISPSFL